MSLSLDGFIPVEEDKEDLNLSGFSEVPEKSDDEIYHSSAKANDIDPDFLIAIDKHESGGGSNLVSPTGVTGRFQMTKGTAARYGVKDRNNFEEVSMGAGRLVKDLSNKYDGDAEKILAAYNTGEGVVDEAVQLAQDSGKDWKDEIPNTRAINNVTEDILRAYRRQGKPTPTFEEEKQKKIAEIANHRNQILNIYNKLIAGRPKPEELDMTGFEEQPTEQPQQEQPAQDEDIFSRLGKAWGRSVGGLEGGIGGALELTHIPLIKDLGNMISNDAKSLQEFYKVDDPKLVDKIAEGVSSGLQFLVPALGVAKGSAIIAALGNTAKAAKIASWLGIGTNAVMEAATEAGNSYNVLQEKGTNDKEATTRALSSFGANLTLITATNAVGGMFGRDINKVRQSLPELIKQGAKKLPQEMASEGVQEGLQTGIGQVTEKEKLDPKQMGEDALLGAATAGIISPIGMISENQQRQPEEVKQEQPVQQPIEEESDAFFGRGTPEKFVDDYNNQTEQSKQFMVENLSDEEYAQIMPLIGVTEVTSPQEDTQSTPTEQTPVEQPVKDYESMSDEELLKGMEQFISEPEPLVEPIARTIDPERSKIANEEFQNYVKSTEKGAPSEEVSQETNQEALLNNEPVRATNETVEQPVVSSSEQPSTEVVQPSEPVKKVEPKKDPTKYTFDDLKSIADSSKKKTALNTIASEAGIVIPKNQTWKKTVYEYTKKFGTEEDIAKAETLMSDFSIKSSESKQAKKIERAENNNGDDRTELQLDKANTIKEIMNNGLVEYDPAKHDWLVKKDKKGELYIPSSDWNKSLRIENINDKQYVSVNEQYKHKKTEEEKLIEELNADLTDAPKVTPLPKMKPKFETPVSNAYRNLENKLAAQGNSNRKGSPISSYNEEVKYTGTDKEDLLDESLNDSFDEKSYGEEDNYDSALAAKEDYEDADFKKAKALLDDMFFTRKMIDLQKYEFGLKKLREQFDDMTDETVRYSKEPAFDIKSVINEDKLSDLEILRGTEENKTHGNDLASLVPEVSFNGVQEGFKYGSKQVDPMLYFTLKNSKMGTTFGLPLNATKEQLIKVVNDKKNEYARSAKLTQIQNQVKEAVKMFGISENLPEVRVDDSIQSKKGQREKKIGSNDYGAITKENGKPVILINPNIDPNEVLPTILHEMIGHYGASKVFNEIDIEIAQHIRDLFEKDKQSEFTQKIARTYANQIQKNYNVLFDEWVAKRFEDISQEYFTKEGKFNEQKFNQESNILTKVYDYIKSLVDKVFNKWFQKDATEEEIRDAVKATLQLFKKIRPRVSDKVETRKSTKEIEPKKKRKALKNISKKEKLETYTKDRIKLETAKDVKQLKVRFFDFSTRHLYTYVNGISPDSYRKQLFDQINKVKEIGDENYKKALEMVDEFSDWSDAAKIYSKIKEFKKTNRKLLSKKDDKNISKIVRELESLDKQYEDFTDYQTLKRLQDRVTVKRPFKKGTTEVTNPSERYNRLIEKGVVDPNVKDKDGNLNYKLAKPEYLKDLKGRLTDNQTGNMFGTGELLSKFNQIKEKLNTNVKNNIKELKITKKKTVDVATTELINHIKNFDRKVFSEQKNEAMRSVIRLIKKGDLHTSNLEYIANLIDNFDENGPFTKYIFDTLNEARNNTLRFGQEMTDFLQDELKFIPTEELKKYSDSFYSGLWSFMFMEKKNNVTKNKLKLESGDVVELTSSQKISLYMIAQNEDGLRHLLGGGFLFEDKSKTFKVTAKDIENVDKSLTSNERKVADILFKYYEKQGDAINKVSNEDIGIDLAGVYKYHPLRVDGDSIEKQVESIKSLNELKEHFKMGSPANLKQRTKSTKPLILEGAFEALARTSDLVEKYVGQALPSKKVEAIFNNIDLRKEMKTKGLDLEYDTMKKIFDEFSKPASYRSGVGDKMLRVIQNRFTVATLGYKIGTALMQPPSALLYLNEINLDSKEKAKMIKDFKPLKDLHKDGDKIEKLVYQYSPMLRNRYEGHVDRDLGELAYKAKARQRVIGSEKNIVKKAFTSEGAMSMISKMDKLSVTLIWRMVEREISAKGVTPGTESFYKQVAKRTEYIVRRTQSTYDVIDRPLVTSSNTAFRAVTMFTSQPIKMLMLVRRAVHNIKSDNPHKRLVGYLGLTNVILLQPLMIEAVRLAWKSMRGEADDEEWVDGWNWLKKIATNNVQYYPVIGGIIGSAVQGFDVNFGGPPQEFINRALKLGNAIYKNFEDGVNVEATLTAAKKLADIIAPITGLEQMVEALKHTIDILSGEE